MLTQIIQNGRAKIFLNIGKEKWGNTGIGRYRYIICSVKEGRKGKTKIGAIRKYGILKSSEK